MKKAGTGTIKQRKNGLYEGQYYFEGKRKSIYSRDINKLRADLNVINAEILKNVHTEPSKMTLLEWLNDWLTTYASGNIRNATLISYETYIRGHIGSDKIAKIKLKDLTSRHFQEFFNTKAVSGRLDKKKGGLSEKTRKNIRNMLHEALEQAVMDKLISSNPVTVKIGTSEKEMRFLDRFEQARLETAVISTLEMLAKGIIISLYTGIRLGELLGLKWSDINFNDKSIKIAHTLARQDITKKQGKPIGDKFEIIKYTEGNHTAIVLGPVKTKAGKRKIYLPTKAFDALSTLQKYQQTINPCNSKQINPHGFVLCDINGDAIDPRTYLDIFQRHVKQAGISDVNFHALRHTFATRAVESGIDIITLSKILGHEKPSTTANMYCHSTDFSQRQCVTAFNQLNLG